jgi:hypothetical protein
MTSVGQDPDPSASSFIEKRAAYPLLFDGVTLRLQDTALLLLDGETRSDPSHKPFKNTNMPVFLGP